LLLAELYFPPDDKFIPHLNKIIGSREKIMQDPKKPEKLGYETGNNDELGARSGNQYSMAPNRGDGKLFKHGDTSDDNVIVRMTVKMGSKEGEPTQNIEDQLESDDEDYKTKIEKIFGNKPPYKTTGPSDFQQ